MNRDWVPPQFRPSPEILARNPYAFAVIDIPKPHEVQVTRTYTMGAMSGRARFRSSCSCGWSGPTRVQTKAEPTAEAACARSGKDAEKHSARFAEVAE